jgi:hypothetical protein
MMAIIEALVPPALMLAAIAWLAKVLIVNALRRESDRLRTSLEKDAALGIENVRQAAARELEAARHSYNRDLEEHKVRFSRLQDIRIEPICDLYAKLAGMCSQASTVEVYLQIDTDTDLTKDIERLRVAMVDAIRSFDAALLYLPQHVIELVDQLIEAIRDAELAYHLHLQRDAANLGAAQRLLMKQLPRNLSLPLRDLADKIRAILGVEVAPTAKAS